MAKFLAVKTETKISGLSLDFFLLWPGMVILCEVFFFMCYCWQFNNMLNMCKIC